MFFKTADLPKGLFKASIVPRPIAWVSTISTENITNLAPFSYFQAISDMPPMIMFVVSTKNAAHDLKDTIINIQNTKEFVINLVSLKSMNDMILSSNSLDHNISEIDMYKIATTPSHLVKPPSVISAPIKLECTVVSILDIPENLSGNKMIIGKILGINIEEEFFDNGKLIYEKLQIISRMGYNNYAVIEKILSA